MNVQHNFSLIRKSVTLAHIGITATILLFFLSVRATAQNESQKNDAKLIDEYIVAKGYQGVIVFDASNIKQFWISNSVVSKNNTINIFPENKEKKSIPLKIQLVNIIETQDCKIDVISENPFIKFTVLNEELKDIGQSSKEEDFIQYHIESSKIHMEDTKGFALNLCFILPEDSESIVVNKIVLSFSENKESKYKGSPGFNILKKELETNGITVPNSTVKYMFAKDCNKIFIKAPKELTQKSKFSYHVVPLKKEDVAPGREKYGFNNLDRIVNEPSAIIPKPYHSESTDIIIQVPLPAYEYSRINLGQFSPDTNESFWKLEIKNELEKR